MDNGETVLGGRYRLLDVLGDGGMARVYRAEDIRLKRTVALKTPHEQYRGQPDFRRRFEQEAHLAGRLAHPNIVAIYDIGYDGTVPFLVMEYVDGGSLKRLLAQQGVPPLPRVLAIMHQLGQALDAAHARGVIHRDIKPENILLTSEGHVKVSDFGIARARDTTDHTTTGVVVGSATYLAPEQAQGRTVTPQTDLYSSGVVLYEMLTGHPPFSAETAVATALQHVTRQPSPPSALVPGLPSRVDAVVLRALAKEPRARYASGEMLADSLGSALGAWSRAGNTRPHQAISAGAMPGAGGGLRYHAPAIPAAPPAPRGRKPNAYALPLALVLLLGTSTAVALNGVRDLVGSPVAALGSGASPAARPALPARPGPRTRHAVVVRHRSRALLAGFVPLSVAPALPDLVLEHLWRVPHSTHTVSRAPRTAARPARHSAPRPHPTPPAPGLSPAISLSIAHAVGYNYVPIAVSRRFVLGTGPAYVIARWGSLGPGHAVSLSWSSPGGSAGSYRGCAGWWNVCFTQVPLQAAGTYTVTFFVDTTAVRRRQFVVSGS